MLFWLCLCYLLGVTVDFDLPPKCEVVAEFVDIQVPHLVRYGTVMSPLQSLPPYQKALFIYRKLPTAQAVYKIIMLQWIFFCCVGSGGQMHGIPTIGVAWHFCCSKNLILTLAHMCSTCWLQEINLPMACTCKSAKIYPPTSKRCVCVPMHCAHYVCVIYEGDLNNHCASLAKMLAG